MKQHLRKPEKIQYLSDRDGYVCFICKEPFVHWEQPTIDHWIPRAAGGTDDLENLRLAHRKCNLSKSNIVPNDDGTLPERVTRIKSSVLRKQRTEIRNSICSDCEEGRLLLEGETCPTCDSEPGPAHAPRYLKRQPKECDHAEYWCWCCSIGIVERKSALIQLISGE